jgi:hypothetical protein
MTRTVPFCTLALVLAAACGGGDAPPPPPQPAAAPAAAPTPPTTLRPARVPTGAFEVVDVDLGTSLAADGRIANPSTTLPRSETIHAVVATEGRASDVTLTARWLASRKQATFSTQQLLEERTQKISPEGPAFTAFQIVKPGGWPAGDYRIEITANGAMAVAKDFAVQ